MSAMPLDARVEDFLAQKCIAVAGVSRDKSHHPLGNLVYDRLKKTGHGSSPSIPAWRPSRAIAVTDVRSIPGGVDGVVAITRPDATYRA